MSAALKPVVEHFSFDGESVGAAGAAALRKVKSLAEAAPQGRLFAAIATLADNAGKAAAEYEAASLATLRNETEEAEARLARGTRMVKRLKEAMSAEVATPLPNFMRLR
jgi:thioredoxin-like negative regulator of GroEL